MISNAATLSLLSVSAAIMRLSDAAVGNYTYQVGDVNGPDNWANLNITDNQCGLDDQSPIDFVGFSGSNCDASSTPLVFEVRLHSAYINIDHDSSQFCKEVVVVMVFSTLILY